MSQTYNNKFTINNNRDNAVQSITVPITIYKDYFVYTNINPDNMFYFNSVYYDTNEIKPKTINVYYENIKQAYEWSPETYESINVGDVVDFLSSGWSIQFDNSNSDISTANWVIVLCDENDESKPNFIYDVIFEITQSSFLPSCIFESDGNFILSNGISKNINVAKENFSIELNCNLVNYSTNPNLPDGEAGSYYFKVEDYAFEMPNFVNVLDYNIDGYKVTAKIKDDFKFADYESNANTLGYIYSQADVYGYYSDSLTAETKVVSYNNGYITGLIFTIEDSFTPEAEVENIDNFFVDIKSTASQTFNLSYSNEWIPLDASRYKGNYEFIATNNSSDIFTINIEDNNLTFSPIKQGKGSIELKLIWRQTEPSITIVEVWTKEIPVYILDLSTKLQGYSDIIYDYVSRRDPKIVQNLSLTNEFDEDSGIKGRYVINVKGDDLDGFSSLDFTDNVLTLDINGTGEGTIDIELVLEIEEDDSETLEDSE